MFDKYVLSWWKSNRSTGILSVKIKFSVSYAKEIDDKNDELKDIFITDKNLFIKIYFQTTVICCYKYIL